MGFETIIGIALGLVGAVASLWFLWERLMARRGLSWHFAEKAVARFIDEMAADGLSPTLIVGIGRGGAVMGALISGALGHRPLVVIDRKYIWQEGRRSDDILLHASFPQAILESVLLVAGEVHSGNTMRLYHEYFRDLGADAIARVALLVQKGATEPVEYVGKLSERNLQLPWMFSKEYRRDSLSEEEAKALGPLYSEVGKVGEEVRRVCFLVRHGESSDNAAGDRFSGVSNAGLTDRGLRQAYQVGIALRGKKIDRIYASPMKRALCTARCIQAKVGGVLLTDARLREMDFGEWEGIPRQEVYNEWRTEYLAWKKDPVEHPPPSSEPPYRVLDRIFSFWQELICDVKSHDLRNVVIVTHTTAGRLLLSRLASQPITSYRDRLLDTGSITKLFVEKDGIVTVVSENVTDHLMDMS